MSAHNNAVINLLDIIGGEAPQTFDVSGGKGKRSKRHACRSGQVRDKKSKQCRPKKCGTSKRRSKTTGKCRFTKKALSKRSKRSARK